METKYNYAMVSYSTEEEAQAAVVAKKSRLENNPTDWCVVKELQDNGDGTWLVVPQALTDSEINNLDESKKYLIYPITGSENAFLDMPLSNTETTAKVLEYRSRYAEFLNLNTIIKYEREEGTTTLPSSMESITPNEDMSGYF